MVLIKKKPLSRRAMLRCGAGGLGALVALPTLQAMFDSDTSFAQSGKPPRFLAIYQPNGHKADDFAPAAGASPDLSGKNLSPIQDQMDVTTVMTNLRATFEGGAGNPHLLAIGSWLRGTHTERDSDNSMQRFTREPGDKSSADVFLAQHYEDNFPLSGGRRQHLVIRGSAFFDPGRTSYNNRQKQWLSTAPDGSRIDAEFDLLTLYDEMFAGLDPAMTDEAAASRLALRKSVLDSVSPDIQRLERRLGAADRASLESYFTNIRTLEDRLQAQIDSPPVTISVPGSGDVVHHKGAGHDSAGWYVDDNYNGRGHNHVDYHWRDTTRLLTVAFQNDTIRSVAYMLESEAGENRYVDGPDGEAGLGDNHAASHSNNAAYGQRDFRHAQVYNDMIQSFKDTEAEGERIIDNTLVLWGAGIGVTHSSDRVMAVMSGLTRPEYEMNHNQVRDMGGASSKPLMQTALHKLGALEDDQSFGEGNNPGDDLDLG